ncbi:hypothetical protein [Nocardia crassostreae]|uniref:hypothetical protein n=1 Tax=Nocardia crassostreae TaxID=53428 RepID=UPI00082C1202|nr:hypothetical protein [Nocardia crassostreae]
MSDKAHNRHKAIIYIYRPLLTSKADLDWAEFYARQRAEALDLRVASVLVTDNSNQDRTGMLYRLARHVDSAYVITPDLIHIGGNARRVTAFAEPLTVNPQRRYRWRLRVSARELSEALELSRDHCSGDRGADRSDCKRLDDIEFRS